MTQKTEELRIVRGNAFLIKIQVEAVRLDGTVVEDFNLSEANATLKVWHAGEKQTKTFTIEGNNALIGFDGTEPLGWYGIEMSGTWQDAPWRFAVVQVFQVVETSEKANVPSWTILTDQTYFVEGVLTLYSSGGASYQADWNETNEQSPSYIKNKPDLSVYATKTELNAEKEARQQAVGDEETRAKAAELVLSDSIAEINGKIPAQASPQNQLADKAFVNSSIATSTATFQGTYNEVSDLSLEVGTSHAAVAVALASAISNADNNDYAFVQIPTATSKPNEIAATERYKFNGTTWEYEYTLNNSGFTAEQWAAINSNITSALVEKLVTLPTNAELQQTLSAFLNSEQVQALITTALQPYSTTEEMTAAITSAIQTALTSYYTKNAIDTLLLGKVDKVEGKQLSTEDFTTALKQKLDGLPDATALAQQIQTAITTALGSYYTKAQTDSLLAEKQTAQQVSAAIAQALTAYSTTQQMNQAISNSITAALADYYTKSQTYSKTEIDEVKAGRVEANDEDTFSVRMTANGKMIRQGKYVFTLINEPTGNPATAGYYEQTDLCKFKPTADTTVQAGKQYFSKSIDTTSNGKVVSISGNGAAIVQLFPEGAGHDFSGDVSLDGTGGNAEAVLRYSDQAGTVEMGYLLCLEAFVSQTLSQAQLDAISAKDTGKQDRDKAVWLTPAGAITSAPTIESGQTEVTFSGWRIAMRVKASEVRDASASTYWFTSGTAGRQVYDVAVAEGIGGGVTGDPYFHLANGWRTGSAMEYLNHMAAQGLPTHSVKAMSALLAVAKIGIKTVKSRNLLNPQTGRALLKAYVNDADGYLDNEYTMLGGLPSGSTMAFTSLLTGKTETLTMLDSTHFVIPSDGWLQITGTLPESIIASWGGEKDNTAADEYATESHTWDVRQMFGTKSGGTDGHYYRFAKEGMRGAGTAQDVVELVGARGEVKVKNGTFPSNITVNYLFNSNFYFTWFPNGGVAGKRFLSAKQTEIGASSNTSNTYIFNETSVSKDAAGAAVIANRIKGTDFFYPLATPITFTSLFLSASSTSDELTQMPADAIPLSEIQFADNNWSIEEAIYDAPEADANGVITPTAVTGQMRIQYSLDAAEQILTLQTEYAALEARVTALENA